MPCAVCAPPQSVSSATAHRTRVAGGRRDPFPSAASAPPSASTRRVGRQPLSGYVPRAGHIAWLRSFAVCPSVSLGAAVQVVTGGCSRRRRSRRERAALGKDGGAPAPKAAFSSLTRGALAAGPHAGASHLPWGAARRPSFTPVGGAMALWDERVLSVFGAW